MVTVSMFAAIATTWIIALQTGSQAVIAGAVVMTFSVLGVLIIYWALTLTQRR